MTGAMSLFSVVAGSLVGWLSERLPARTEALETGAGLLLIGGFALAGCALPVLL